MTDSLFKRVLGISALVVMATHILYVLLGSAARAGGAAAGAAAGFAGVFHAATALVIMWLAFVFRLRYQAHLIIAFFAYVLSSLVLSLLCVAVELPLTTAPGGAQEVFRAAALSYAAYFLWGVILMAATFVSRLLKRP